MDGILRDAARYDRLESLIKQRRYEESIALLDDIIAKTPQDSDAYLYRSLVTRIVALREFCQNQRERPSASSDSASLKPTNEIGARTVPSSPAPARKRRLFGLTRSTAHDWGFRFALTASVLSMAAIVTVIGTDLLLGKSRRLTASAQTPVHVAQSAVETAAVQGDRAGASATLVDLDAAGGQLTRAAGGTDDQLPKIDSPNHSEATPVSAKAATKTKKKKIKGGSRAKAKVEIADEAPAFRTRTTKEYHATASNPLYFRARRPITIRQAARFAAPTIETFSEGTLVQVIGVKNSWAKVQLNGKEPGFVRIEFLGPTEAPSARGESFARLALN